MVFAQSNSSSSWHRYDYQKLPSSIAGLFGVNALACAPQNGMTDDISFTDQHHLGFKDELEAAARPYETFVFSASSSNISSGVQKRVVFGISDTLCFEAARKRSLSINF